MKQTKKDENTMIKCKSKNIKSLSTIENIKTDSVLISISQENVGPFTIMKTVPLY